MAPRCSSTTSSSSAAHLAAAPQPQPKPQPSRQAALPAGRLWRWEAAARRRAAARGVAGAAALRQAAAVEPAEEAWATGRWKATPGYVRVVAFDGMMCSDAASIREGVRPACRGCAWMHAPVGRAPVARSPAAGLDHKTCQAQPAYQPMCVLRALFRAQIYTDATGRKWWGQVSCRTACIVVGASLVGSMLH